MFQGCEEAFIFIHDLQAIMEVEGLILTKTVLLSDYIRENWANKTLRKLWKKMTKEKAAPDFPNMSSSEREAVSLYRVAFFTK